MQRYHAVQQIDNHETKQTSWSKTSISFDSDIDEGQFVGVVKLIQRAKIFYFAKSFQFQCLLGRNGLSVEV